MDSAKSIRRRSRKRAIGMLEEALRKMEELLGGEQEDDCYWGCLEGKVRLSLWWEAAQMAWEEGAGDGTRTRDSLLGRQVLYHLSYSRQSCTRLVNKRQLKDED